MIHLKTNDIVKETLDKFPHKVNVKLGSILKERGMTQGDLHRLTGLRVATINELVHFKKNSLTVAHIVSIMVALRLYDLRELVEIEFDEEIVDYFQKEKNIMVDGYTPDLQNVSTSNVARINEKKVSAHS
ncbi:helix-turn-helix domain-containing protein [Bacillus sp. 2205SS5-2]|uniref:helix-turn-helix domain-containing protein n=1 Tax=Bacillus sp. 2205SS5-2 TaxID=3109031 RepID=UPI003006B06C